MTRNTILLAALLASACQVQKAPEDNAITVSDLPEQPGANAANGTIPVAPPAPGPTNSKPVPIPGRPGQVAHPNPGAPPPTPAEKTPAGAVAVLQAYCDAIAHHDYAGAYRAWGDGGRASGRSAAAFANNLKTYDAYDCSFGAPTDEGGAAGSIYLTVPAVITGTLAKGGGFALRGPFTMRRVNDVDGSTAEQRRWHIESSDLKPRR